MNLAEEETHPPKKNKWILYQPGTLKTNLFSTDGNSETPIETTSLKWLLLGTKGDIQ